MMAALFWLPATLAMPGFYGWYWKSLKRYVYSLFLFVLLICVGLWFCNATIKGAHYPDGVLPGEYSANTMSSWRTLLMLIRDTPPSKIPMKLLFVHPGPLLYTNVFLRLEPLGLELVAAAARRAKHSVRLIDLQVESHVDYHRMIAEWLPDFISLSCD